MCLMYSYFQKVLYTPLMYVCALYMYVYVYVCKLFTYLSRRTHENVFVDIVNVGRHQHLPLEW